MSCEYCKGTGEVKELNQEEFDKYFDYYDNMGQFSMDDVYNKAVKKAGYSYIPCPHCSTQSDQNND